VESRRSCELEFAVHSHFWRALGESKRAAQSITWCYAGVMLFSFYLVIRLLTLISPGLATDAARIDTMTSISAIAFLLIWYFTSARAQVRYVKDRYGASYVRRAWMKPLLIAIACNLGYRTVFFLIGFFCAAVRGS
jgi:hypothetical protein